MITQPCMSFENKMVSGVSRHVFEKKGLENPKNSVFGHFLKTTNTDVLEPPLLPEIDNICSLK